MKGPENRFRDTKIIPLLKELPCYFFIKEAKSIVGIPDIIICMNGKFCALELKRCKRKPSAMQEYHMKWINASRGFARVVYPENAHEVLRELLVYCYGACSVQPLLPLLDEYFPAAQPRRASPRKKR